MNLRILTKIMQSIQTKGPFKLDLRADWTHESNPTAWELRFGKKLFHRNPHFEQNFAEFC